MHKGIVFLAGMLITFSFGCRTTQQIAYLPIDVMIPAKIIFPPEVKNIGIIYRNPFIIEDTTPFLKYFDHTDHPTEIFVKNPLAYLFLETVIRALDESGRFENVDILPETLELSQINASGNTALAFDSILNNYRFKYPQYEMILVADILHNECFSVILKEFGVGYHISITSILWEIINMDDKHTVLYQKSDTLMHPDSFEYKEGLTASIPSDVLFRLEATTESANRFVKSLLPYWETAERRIYRSGNYEMVRAMGHVRNNQWPEAALIWETLTANKNRNIAAKAMYNLALASEITGDLDMAMKWIIESYYVFQEEDPYHSQNTKDYINLLALRKIEIKALEKQLQLPKSDSITHF
jgi:hypothetical protein